MISIIDYKAGNVRSIQNMLKKIGYDSIITADHNNILNSDKLILPGVGSFDYGMDQLEQAGLIPVLNRKVLEEQTPILGICLGVQLFTKNSEEGKHPGLAWFDAKTVSFDKSKLDGRYTIPHMGWRDVILNERSKLFKNIPEEPRFYFVHSYHLHTERSDTIIAETEYGYKFTAGLESGNIVGVQFHPEKSHKFGMQVLKNFIENF